MTTRREIGIVRALRSVLRSPVPPEHRLDLAFGWLVAVMFGVQILTGALLSLHYQPSSVLVAESLELIMRDVHWGWLIRGVHHWASDVLMVVILIQLVKLFVLGAYRGTRATGWTIAVLMLLLFVLATFSGQILRWDDPSWRLAVTSLQQIESIPVFGPGLAGVLRGEEEVTATTLGRTFTAHTLVLPWVAGLLVLLNQWILARRVGRKGAEAR